MACLMIESGVIDYFALTSLAHQRLDGQILLNEPNHLSPWSILLKGAMRHLRHTSTIGVLRRHAASPLNSFHVKLAKRPSETSRVSSKVENH